MSGKVMGAIYDLDLPHPKQSILLALADHAHHDGTNVFASVALIAWKTGYSERQVQRIMHDCESDGLLKVVTPATPRMPANYRIDVSAGKQKEPFQGCQDVTPGPKPGKKASEANVTPGVTKSRPRGDIMVSPEPCEPSIKPSDSDSSFVPQEESFSAVGESLPENYLPIYEWDVPDYQSEGLIHKAVYGTYGNQACLCGYANAGRTMKEPGTRYVECAACFEPPAFSESENEESQLTKGSRKNDPAEAIIPSGYKLLTSANLAEPLHLIAADKSRLAQPLCKKPFSYRMFPTPVISQARTPCADCWRIATTPKPARAKTERKPQPWDVFALAVAQAGFKGVNDKFVGFVLHGVEKQNCRGIIAVECDLQGKERADLDFQALAALVPRFWADYQAQNPGKELRDCSKWTSRWEGWRREQRAKAIQQAKPKPVAHIRFWKDPATGDERHEYCICAIGRNHDD